MGSVRFNFPVIGAIKVKAHQTDETKFYLKTYGAQNLDKLRGFIPEIEATIQGARYAGAAVPREAFKTKAAKAYEALGQEEFETRLARIATEKAEFAAKVGATGDFAANLDARLLAAATPTAPTFAVIDGGADEAEGPGAGYEEAADEEGNDDGFDSY